MRTMLQALVNSPGFQMLPAYRQRELLERTLSRARRTAAQFMVIQHPELMRSKLVPRVFMDPSPQLMGAGL